MKKNFKFSFDLNSLGNYVDQLNTEIILKSITGARTMEYVEMQPGIKYAEALNYLASDVKFQSGSCGWTPSGTTAMTQKEIQVCNLKIQEALCPDELEKKWAGMFMRAGHPTELPFEQVFVDEKIREINKQLELLVWRGDVTGGTENLAVCRGFEDRIKYDTSVVRPIAVSATTWNSAANILASVDAIVAAIPSEILAEDDLVMFVDYATFRNYRQALINANRPSVVTSTEATNYEMFIPGFNVRMVATAGISAGKYALSKASNFVVGTDLMNEQEQVEFFYSRDNREIRFHANFKIGTQYKFGQYIVSNI